MDVSSSSPLYVTSTKLIITSKHSLGPVAGNEVSHAQAGEAWLKKYLIKKGKTEEDLAKGLWESNLTAIAEVSLFFSRNGAF
jgi:tRNA ligase